MIRDYAAALLDGAEFPPVIVFFDGQDYWLASGFYRLQAAKEAGLEFISADVRHGTLRDALLFSAGVNTKHGVSRSERSKWLAVEKLLRDEEWAQWPDREIARRCAVSPDFVAGARKMIAHGSSSAPRKAPAPTSNAGLLHH